MVANDAVVAVLAFPIKLPRNDPVNAPDTGERVDDPDGVIDNVPLLSDIASVPRYKVEPERYKLLNFNDGEPRSNTELSEGNILPLMFTLPVISC